MIKQPCGSDSLADAVVRATHAAIRESKSAHMPQNGMYAPPAHPITDNTSPEHEGTQVWNPSDEASVAGHVAGESTISKERMDQAVKAIRDAYKETFGPKRLDQAIH